MTGTFKNCTITITDPIPSDDSIDKYEHFEYEPVVGTNLNNVGDIRINIETQDIFMHPSESFLLIVLCTYPVIPSFVHVCIYFWFPLWLFLELDFLLWNIVLEVSGPVYNLITTNYASDFNMNFLEVSLLL